MNEERRRNEQMAEARRQFAGAVSRGQVVLKDRLGREIKAGDRVLFRNVIDPIYTVLSVDPVLDPRMQPGLMRVQLSVTYPVDHPGNMNHPHMVVVASQDPMTAPVGAENNGSGTDDEQARVTKDATEQDAPGPKLVTPSLDEPPT